MDGKNAIPLAVGSKRLPPDPAGTAIFIGRIGYSLEEALSDLIDNSIDAEAKNVVVQLVRGPTSLVHVLIADDGRGMSEDELHTAMTYGVQLKHDRENLGKYGIGLKAASFSQCRSLTVISRKNKQTSGRRWTQKSIADEWRVELLDANQSSVAFDFDFSPVASGRAKGTLVIWDDLENKVMSPSEGEFNKIFQDTFTGLRAALGLRFHRFIERGTIKITLSATNAIDQPSTVSVEVKPLDPFGYSKTGKKGYPTTFELSIQNYSVKAVAHIWPPKSKDDNYNLGKGQVSGRQGFYFYRNDRLIRAGGWHGMKNDSEPHSSLARVMIDMPPALDSFFRLTVQKNDFNVPSEFVKAVHATRAGDTSFVDYLKSAEDTYRTAPEAYSAVFYPEGGVPSNLSRKLGSILSQSNDTEMIPVDIVWEDMDDEHKIVEVQANATKIVINRAYRDQITGGKNSAADAPLVKVLLFLLLEDCIHAKKISAKLRERIEIVNNALYETVKQIK